MLNAKTYVATLATADMDRAKEFYIGKLGFELVMEDPTGMALSVPGSDGMVLGIYPSGFAGTNQATAISFEVDDVPATVAAMRAGGLQPEEYDLPDIPMADGIATTPDGAQVAWFTDPDGNIFSVSNHHWGG